MGKTYVDMEQLDYLFRQYNIPYIDTMDDLETVLAEDMAKELSVAELKNILQEKDGVIAIKVWEESDVQAAAASLGMQLDRGQMENVIRHAKNSLLDCTDEWGRLHEAVKQHVQMEEYIK